MRQVATIGLIFLPLVGFGQLQLTDEQIINSGMIKLVFVDNARQADSLARMDISRGIPFLLLQSGISPVVYSTDSKFEEKYRVFYDESGCTGPKLEFAKTYNKVTFEYLTKNYGRKWTKEIRKDVIGFREWRRTGG